MSSISRYISSFFGGKASRKPALPVGEVPEYGQSDEIREATKFYPGAKEEEQAGSKTLCRGHKGASGYEMAAVFTPVTQCTTAHMVAHDARNSLFDTLSVDGGRRLDKLSDDMDWDTRKVAKYEAPEGFDACVEKSVLVDTQAGKTCGMRLVTRGNSTLPDVPDLENLQAGTRGLVIYKDGTMSTWGTPWDQAGHWRRG